MTNTLSISKFVAALVASAMAISLVFALPAKADTADDLAAQIQSLLATIAGLQAQLAAMQGGGTTGGTTGACGVTFTQNHSQGDSGGQVMDIQKFLNGDAATTVASTGAGSPGSESSYFGSLTKAAVSKFQAKYASDVLAPVGLSAPTGFWGPSSIAKANALNASCVPGVPGVPGVPSGTGVSVSAAAQPGNSLAPGYAKRIPFTRFTVTNNGSGAVAINSVTVERTGLAADSNFASIILLDGNGNVMGREKSLNSNHQAIIGEDVTLASGASATFTVAANMKDKGASGLNAGEVAAFSVVSINTTATVSGTLPITGAQHTINGTLTIGDVTIDEGSNQPSAGVDKEVGTTDLTFVSVEVEAGATEDITLSSIRFYQEGNAASTDLANLVAVVDGTEYAVTVSADGKYYLVQFGSGITIDKGTDIDVKLKGDIVGGASREIKFDVRRTSDVNAIGNTYGYGVRVIDNFDAADIDIQTGKLTVTKDTSLGNEKIVEGAEDTLAAIKVKSDGEGVTIDDVIFENSDGTTQGFDIDNMILVDENGVAIAGPETYNTTTNKVTFTNVNFPIGEHKYYLKGKLDKTDFSDGQDVTFLATEWSGATGDVSGDNITGASFVGAESTTEDVTLQTMTVDTLTLAINHLAQPKASNISSDTADYLWTTAVLDAAGSGEDVTAEEINLTASSTGSKEVDLDAFSIWADLTSADSARGDKYETQVSDEADLGTSAVTFSLTNQFDVSKNGQVGVALVGDLSSSASSTDEHQIGISNVKYKGTKTRDTANATASTFGKIMTVAAGGTLTSSVDSSSPDAAIILDDTSNKQTLAIFKLKSSSTSSENLNLDELDFTMTGWAAVDTYYIEVDGTEIGTRSGGVSANVTLENISGVSIAPDADVKVKVLAIMNDVDDSGVTNSTDIAVVLDYANTKGAVSSTAANDANDRTADTHTLYESKPVFATDNSIGTSLSPSTDYLLAKFVVSVTGDKEVNFASSTNQVKVDVTFSKNDGSSVLALTMKDGAGNTLDTVSTTATSSATGEKVTFDFTTKDLDIAGEGTGYMYVYANTVEFEDNGDSVQLKLNDDADANLEFGVDDGGGDYAEGVKIFRNDIVGPSHVNPS